MEVTAKSKYVRISPRKARAVADVVSKMRPTEAIDNLGLLIKSGSKPILSTLKSAIANAAVKQLKMEDLKIKNILVDEGMRMKRRDKSHGARYGGGLIHKRTSHITITLQG